MPLLKSSLPSVEGRSFEFAIELCVFIFPGEWHYLKEIMYVFPDLAKTFNTLALSRGPFK